jgi:hypothetical protein
VKYLHHSKKNYLLFKFDIGNVEKHVIFDIENYFKQVSWQTLVPLGQMELYALYMFQNRMRILFHCFSMFNYINNCYISFVILYCLLNCSINHWENRYTEQKMSLHVKYDSHISFNTFEETFMYNIYALRRPLSV